MKKPGTTDLGKSSFGWHIQMMARLVESETQKLLKPFDLSVAEFSCLLGLLEENGATQSELGRLTGAPEYSTSRYVDRLVERGFAERRPHPESRRAIQVFLTEQGEELAVQMPQVVSQANDNILVGLTENQRSTLESLLEKAIDQLRGNK